MEKLGNSKEQKHDSNKATHLQCPKSCVGVGRRVGVKGAALQESPAEGDRDPDDAVRVGTSRRHLGLWGKGGDYYYSEPIKIEFVTCLSLGVVFLESLELRDRFVKIT